MTPFFEQRLIPCAPDGRYSDLALRRRVSLTPQGVALGPLLIDPAYVDELQARGPVLQVRYVTASGAFEEAYFFYSKFRSQAAGIALREAVKTAKLIWAGRMGCAVTVVPPAAPSVSIPAAPVRTASDSRPQGRARVDLPSAKVAFPVVCPVCGRGASHVSARVASAGDNERGRWLVPVCDEHEVGDSIRIEKWRANATEVGFSFTSLDYAREFARANERSARAESGDLPGAGGLGDDGRRFITYQYVVSAIHASFLLDSRVFALRDGESRVAPGLRYSLLTAITGWWALPGVVLTLAALRQNFRGGIDITEQARAALRGKAFTAYGIG